MKSALANIGMPELSANAFQLEKAAQYGEIELMASETAAFIDALRKVVRGLTMREENDGSATADENKPYLYEKLIAIKAACSAYDVKALNDAIMQLSEKSWSQSTHNLLSAISKYLLSSDFEDIVDAVDDFLDSDR